MVICFGSFTIIDFVIISKGKFRKPRHLFFVWGIDIIHRFCKIQTKVQVLKSILPLLIFPRRVDCRSFRNLPWVLNFHLFLEVLYRGQFDILKISTSTVYCKYQTTIVNCKNSRYGIPFENKHFRRTSGFRVLKSAFMSVFFQLFLLCFNAFIYVVSWYECSELDGWKRVLDSEMKGQSKKIKFKKASQIIMLSKHSKKK